jgi:hypothetical protein
MALATALLVLAQGIGEKKMGVDKDSVRFTRVAIDETPPDRPWYKMLGDINGDGFLDIVVAGASGPMVWYKYPGWDKMEIASKGWDGVNGEIADVDGDGDNDIVMGGVVWFRNPRSGAGRWAMQRIDTKRAHDIELGDLDMDGRLDVVARDQSAFGKAGNEIYVYLQGSPNSWTKHTIPCPHGEGLKLADMDQDRDPDIVIGGRWYENTRQPGNWKEHSFTTAWAEPDAKVEVADINGDGHPDIVLTPAELAGERYKIAWYEGPGDPKGGDWTEHIIVPEIECVIHSLGVGDFDRDGDIDIVIAEMHQGQDPDEVAVHLNLGKGKTWRKQVISTQGSHDLAVGDISGDGDLDIVGANHGGKWQRVELWQNTSCE